MRRAVARRGPGRLRRLARASLAGAALAAVASCGVATAADPFRDAGADDSAGGADGASGGVGGAGAGAGAAGSSGADAGGKPCTRDADCDDSVECTFDQCDPLTGRCRNVPDDARCLDDVHCDGVERCDPLRGCVEGVPQHCPSQDVCKVAGCDESSRGCSLRARDADGDGDPPWNCPGGTDCNDQNARVSGKAAEVCANRIDDDCDGEVDEPDCVSSEHDGCLTALEVRAPGTYALSLAGARLDYGASCIASGGATREVVVAVQVPEPDAADVVLTARAGYGNLWLAHAAPCGDPGGELGCRSSSAAPAGGTVARLRARGVPAGFHAFYVAGDGDQPVTLRVDFEAPTAPPANETCASSARLLPGVTVPVSIVDAAVDHDSACSAGLGELAFHFELEAPSDVELFASSVDGVGLPVVSLRDAVCEERTCRAREPALLFARALPAGRHHVTVSATAPTDLVLRLEVRAPTPEPDDERCAPSAPLLVPGRTEEVSFEERADDHGGCSAGATDVARRLPLAERSDVLVVQRISQNDAGWVSLWPPGCVGGMRACGTSTRSPVRAAARDVAPGELHILLESQLGSPASVTAFVRRATPPVLVAFAGDCAEAVPIPETGGAFQGNTANAEARHGVSCDLGGQPPGGAPEQFLRLDLSRRRRVVFDMKGSAYATLLAVRAASSCPGADLPQACAAGYVQDRSFLDLVLDAGTYLVQVDGYNGQSGTWFLDVHVAEPP